MTPKSIPNIPPHFIREKRKEVVFHIPGGHPIMMLIDFLMKRYFPVEYKAVLIRCPETFYHLRVKGYKEVK